MTTTLISAAGDSAALGAASICQICFEAPQCDISESSDDSQVASAALSLVTRLCGPKCTASICVSCLQRHLDVAITAAFAGVLPRVRCPICLTRLNASQWDAYATPTLRERYREACQCACRFQSPCCHNTLYTQLPIACTADKATDTSINVQPLAPLLLVPSLQRKLPALRRLARRFCFHKATAQQVMQCLEDEFGRATSLETQTLLLEHLLPRIVDDERRATLLLRYHTKYKKIRTRCCGSELCFNCKRAWLDGTDPQQCDERDIRDDCVVQCRGCRVTIVKVEGCDYVQCLCGFGMDWHVETQLAALAAKQLVPVDRFDTAVCDAWWSARYNMLDMLKYEVLPYVDVQTTPDRARPNIVKRFQCRRHYAAEHWRLRVQLRVRCSDYLFRKNVVVQSALRRYIWYRRFKRAIPQWGQAMRLRFGERVLAQQPVVRAALRRYIWQWRFTHAIPQWEEAMRLRVGERAVARQPAVRAALRRYIWQWRFSRSMPKLERELHLRIVDRVVRQNAPMRRLLLRFIWQQRFQHALPTLQTQLEIAIRARAVRLALQSVRVTLRKFLQRVIWRRRFQRAVPKLQRELRFHRIGQVAQRYRAALRPHAQCYLAHVRWKRVSDCVVDTFTWRDGFAFDPLLLVGATWAEECNE